MHIWLISAIHLPLDTSTGYSFGIAYLPLRSSPCYILRKGYYRLSIFTLSSDLLKYKRHRCSPPLPPCKSARSESEGSLRQFAASAAVAHEDHAPLPGVRSCSGRRQTADPGWERWCRVVDRAASYPTHTRHLSGSHRSTLLLPSCTVCFWFVSSYRTFSCSSCGETIVGFVGSSFCS